MHIKLLVGANGSDSKMKPMNLTSHMDETEQAVDQAGVHCNLCAHFSCKVGRFLHEVLEVGPEFKRVGLGHQCQ